MAQNAGSRPTGGQRELITLAQPRPAPNRITNDYIETPLRPQLPVASSLSSTRDAKKRPSPSPPTMGGPPALPAKKDPSSPTLPLPTVHRPGTVRTGGRGLVSSVVIGVPPGTVTTQPTTFKKEKAREAAESPSLAEEGHADSIICRECRRCKCEACRTPRPLPSKWICNDKFPCSAPALVDYCSCLCCVKGLFYHLTKDYEMDSDVSCADKPCSCSPHKCCPRWTCLGLLSLAFPCLCFYWPLRGCVRLCEVGYSGVTGKGCHCNHQRTEKSSGKAPPEKRLLDSNSDC